MKILNGLLLFMFFLGASWYVAYAAVLDYNRGRYTSAALLGGYLLFLAISFVYLVSACGG